MSTPSSPFPEAGVFCLVLFRDKTVGKHKQEEEEEEAGNGGHFDLFHPSGTKTNWTRMNGGRKKGGIKQFRERGKRIWRKTGNGQGA